MLIALHGFTEIDLSWQEVLRDSGLDYRCLLLPGHGGLPCPADTTTSGLAAGYAEQLRDSEPYDLIGYSIGGSIALQWALDYPQAVRRLILVSCHAGIADPDAREQRRLRDEGIARMLEENGINQFVAWWENNPALRSFRPLSRLLQEHIRARRLNQDALGLAACLRCLSQGCMPDFTPRLQELQMPVLALCGASDQRYLPQVEEMVKRLPQGQLALIPECGHAVHRECPTELLHVINSFLAG